MTTIELQPIPNQTVQFQAGEETYTIRVKKTKNAMICDIERNGTPVIMGLVCNPFTRLIPYKYLETNGNFAFDTMHNRLIDYTLFGTSQFLYYIPSEELND